MFSADFIIEMQADAAAKAAQAKKTPLVIWPEDLGKIETLQRIPNLGSYTPPGWRRIDPATIKPNRTEWASGRVDGVPGLFVDATSLSGEDEIAMSVEEFAKWLVPNYGYAIVEEGQFQVTIGVFEKQ